MQISLALLVLRVGAGGLMLAGHGWAKLVGFTDKLSTFPDPLGIGPGFSLALATFAEVLCSFLLIIGLATRFAAAALLTTMLVAVVLVHADDPFSKKELALVYIVPFFALVLAGGGDYSIDATWWRPRRRVRL